MKVARIVPIVGYVHAADVRYYGKTLYRSKRHPWNVSGAIERSDLEGAVWECEEWALKHGFDSTKVLPANS